MKQNNWSRILLRAISYVLVAAIGTFAGIGIATGRLPGAQVLGQTKLDQLEQLILEQYIDGADPVVLEDAAADAMVRATGDRWSYYVPAAQYQSLMEGKNNAYVGIGVTILLQEDGSMLVQKVEPDGPALEAGIQPGDLLTYVEGQSVAELGLDGCRDLIRGQEGTDLSVAVSRDGEELTFRVTRRQIVQQVATFRMLPDQIGYIRIRNFNEHCARDTIAAIEQLRSQGAEALIFDVRFNPGGYKRELVEVLDYLLPEGPLFRSRDYQGREEVDQSDADCLEMPMAVLVNGDSYSAAEFFAAALREYDWAFIAGSPTVGKGNFQYTVRLQDGSAVGLSVGKYYTPKGVSLADEGGLIPDYSVEVDEDTAAQIYADLLPAEQDAQLQAAIAALTK